MVVVVVSATLTRKKHRFENANLLLRPDFRADPTPTPPTLARDRPTVAGLERGKEEGGWYHRTRIVGVKKNEDGNNNTEIKRNRVSQKNKKLEKRFFPKNLTKRRNDNAGELRNGP